MLVAQVYRSSLFGAGNRFGGMEGARAGEVSEGRSLKTILIEMKRVGKCRRSRGKGVVEEIDAGLFLLVG